MNKLISIIAGLSLAHLTLADDTEIYGASEIDESQRVNSNVLFIMDTSGSMGGQVAVVNDSTYNPNQTYSGHYQSNYYYAQKQNSGYSYIPTSAFETNQSTNCTDDLATLASAGRVLGSYQQQRHVGWDRVNNNWVPRYAWRDLQHYSNNAARCDNGSSYWLYTGNYLNWKQTENQTTYRTRMEITVDVVKELTNSLSNINLGLMRFDRNSDGGMIDVPVSDVASSGALIRDKLDDYYPDGGTPLEETMYEAARYYRGESWMFGNDSNPNASVNSSRSGSKYTTPITATCQKNHIILLTDGEPTNDTSANDDVRTKVSNLTLPNGLSKSCSGSGECMDELAYWLRNTDQSDNLIGDQPITTYTIGGFDLQNGVELLKRTANWGGGQYYEANDTDGLTDALESIFLDILATDSTFTAPAVSVNAFNASEHRDELFYALFRPDDSAKWAGNLKKYRLDEDGFVRDANDNTAISEASGFFNEGAKDFWNAGIDPDGKNVTLGGMANLINPSNRSVYTEDSANTLGNFYNFATAESLDMISASAAEVEKVKKWAMGFDVNDNDGDASYTDSRNSIGDPLHSEPVVVTYGGNDENPDSTIYFGTNEGFIHAIDTQTGLEEFAFIPKILHQTQKIFYNDSLAAGSRPYGMDGHITTWMYDKNNDNVILDSGGNVQSDEHVYLYAGMRRGGNQYYALDVTNRNAPRMLFKIEGGSGDFARLGQTWSRMTVAKVKFPGGESDGTRFVAFFTGGYDTNQDANDLSEPDAIGNAIYMVDAKTGERLWWASNTGSGADLEIAHMDNSMPASISAVDITGDGLVNYFFAADTGGRVFRIDLSPNVKGASTFADGGMIASLAGTDEENNRRFYNKPNVSLVKDKQYGDYLTIGIGSGHRAHPIFTTDVENRFYMIKDYSPYGKPRSYRVRSEAAEDKSSLAEGENADPLKLYNATDLMNEGSSALTSDIQVLMNNGAGWYVTFDSEGEKVLAESTTFSGAVIFTTFSPSSGDSTSTGCGPDTGTSRVYALDQRWATASVDLDGDGDTDADDASKALAHSGIAPRPVIIYRKGGGKSIAIGTETIDDDRFQQNASDENCADNDSCNDQVKKCEGSNCYVVPVYWRQNEIDASAGGY